MTAKTEDLTFVHEAKPELLALCSTMRPDWDIERLDAALLGAKHAGWSWVAAYRAVHRLLLIRDSQPYHLAEEVRASSGYRQPSGTGLPAEYTDQRHALGGPDAAA